MGGETDDPLGGDERTAIERRTVLKLGGVVGALGLGRTWAGSWLGHEAGEPFADDTSAEYGYGATTVLPESPTESGDHATTSPGEAGPSCRRRRMAHSEATRGGSCLDA